MSHTLILSWVTFVYLAALTFYLVRMVSGKEAWGKAATFTLLGGLAAHTVALGLRWAESYRLGMGHAPLSNFYESLIFFAWAIVLLYLIVEWRIQNRSPGVFVIPVAFLSMAYASLSPTVENRISPLIPALRSNWLTSHVLTCFMGYACFTIAFGLAVMFLLKGRAGGDASSRLSRILPDEDSLDDLMYQCSALGFIFLTLGIATGSVWAHYAWGSYWSWDPKETWSLITWFVYAALLHSRFVRGWKGRRMAYMALLGFAAVLFTYFGVNYLPSLHSYT